MFDNIKKKIRDFIDSGMPEKGTLKQHLWRICSEAEYKHLSWCDKIFNENRLQERNRKR